MKVFLTLLASLLILGCNPPKVEQDRAVLKETLAALQYPTPPQQIQAQVEKNEFAEREGFQDRRNNYYLTRYQKLPNSYAIVVDFNQVPPNYKNRNISPVEIALEMYPELGQVTSYRLLYYRRLLDTELPQPVYEVVIEKADKWKESVLVKWTDKK